MEELFLYSYREKSRFFSIPIKFCHTADDYLNFIFYVAGCTTMVVHGCVMAAFIPKGKNGQLILFCGGKNIR
jgi:hypothetical protein